MKASLGLYPLLLPIKTILFTSKQSLSTFSRPILSPSLSSPDWLLLLFMMVSIGLDKLARVGKLSGGLSVRHVARILTKPLNATLHKSTLHNSIHNETWEHTREAF